MTRELAALERLARAAGAQSRYLDVDGRSVRVPPDTLVAVLNALGVEIRAAGDAADALRRLRSTAAGRIAPSVRVLWDESPSTLWLRLPDGDMGLELRLRLENGTETSWREQATPFAVRERYGIRRVIARLALPELPIGYHRLSLRAGAASRDVFLLRAPTRSYRDDTVGRRWGLFAPVYALHSRESSSVGTYAELGRLARLVQRVGGDFVATLPFYAQRPSELSPYSPMSRLFWNELFVDSGELPPAPPQDPIDYDAWSASQRGALEARFRREKAATAERVSAFADSRPDLADFARFVARSEGRDVEAAGFHVYVQWLAESQIDEARRQGARLYLDLPLGVHREGYDVHRQPELFAHGIDGGAPPDAAFPGGQNWSFPPILPTVSREQGHDYLRRVVRHSMRHAALLRVDHVMGLHRQFWIPRGEGADAGTYVRYPAEELYAVLSLESHRARCELIGEDLGIVPDVVRTAMTRHALRGLYVAQLAGGASVPREVVASLNTHDTATHAGAGGDASSLERELRRLIGSPADVVSLSLEDLWLEAEPQNVPGTSLPERRNWSRPLRYGIEDIEARYGAQLRALER